MNRLKDLREDNDLLQKDIAKKLGISQQYYSQYELGKYTMPIELLIELANKPYIKRLSILGGEPLVDENLDGVLHLVNRFRLSFPNKSIWVYSGYQWENIMKYE